MIEAPDFLPLGSIVTLMGNDEKKLIIIGRALAIDHDDTLEYYDYAMVMYPEGLLGDAIVYSNHDCITKVFAEGFADEEDEALVAELKDMLTEVDIPKATPQVKDVW